MIILISSVSKSEFVEQLSSQSGQPGVLYINVESLPAFLDTQVSATIFSYQLSNYPREIFWASKDGDILQLLRDSQLNVVDNYFKPHHLSEQVSSEDVPEKSLDFAPGFSVQINSTPDLQIVEEHRGDRLKTAEINPNKVLTVLPETKLKEKEVRAEVDVPEMLIDTSQLSKSGFFNQNSLDIVPNLNLDSHPLKKQDNKTISLIELEENKIEQKDKSPDSKLNIIKNFTGRQNSISLASLLNQDKYYPSSIIDDEELEIDEDNKIDAIADTANLDSWLERIQATKEALNSLRATEANINQDFFDHRTVKPKSKWFYTILASSFVSLLVVGFLVFFPTQVYTLEVYSNYEDGTFVLDAGKQSLSKKDVLLESKQIIPTQNKEKMETERASGTVKLINESGRDVLLDNAKFQLLKDGYRYTPIYNNTLLKTFSIPAQNNKSDDALQFTIQSVPQAGILGSAFNQPAGTRLKIVNLQDQNPCSSCYAVVVTDISNKNGEGNKIVSNADYDSLKNLSEQDIQKERISKMQEIRADKVFISNSWYKDIENNYNFSAKIGEKAENVELKTSINSEIYYILRTSIEEKIRAKNPDVDKIKDLALISSEGKLDTQDGIKANFYYTYSKKNVVDTSNVSGLLADKEFEQAKNDISKQYPSIKRVEKQDLGIKLPGISPRKEIKIVEKE